MEKHVSFKDYSIVSCGILYRELNYLRDTGFLNADKILYTEPGLHANPDELKLQLTRKLEEARNHSWKIIVVYGKDCHPEIDRITQGEGISRVDAEGCIDMLADSKQRTGISEGEKIYWLSPGWLKFWKQIFKAWDIGLANETFPQNDTAIILDSLNIFSEYSEQHPEKLLELSDWMKIPIEPYTISLERLKGLLSDCVVRDMEKKIEELKDRWPIHSAKPSMLAELEDLEEKRDAAKEAGRKK